MLAAVPALKTLYQTAPGCHIAYYFADVLLRSCDIHIHNRLQLDRGGLSAGVVEAHGSGSLVGKLGGCKFVVFGIYKFNCNLYHRITEQGTGSEAAGDTPLYCLDKLHRELLLKFVIICELVL